jgi:hypothetical protein
MTDPGRERLSHARHHTCLKPEVGPRALDLSPRNDQRHLLTGLRMSRRNARQLPSSADPQRAWVACSRDGRKGSLASHHRGAGHSFAMGYLRSATRTLPAMTSGMPFTNSKTFALIQLAAISFEANASSALSNTRMLISSSGPDALQAALEARQGVICDQWSRCSNTGGPHKPSVACLPYGGSLSQPFGAAASAAVKRATRRACSHTSTAAARSSIWHAATIAAASDRHTME